MNWLNIIATLVIIIFISIIFGIEYFKINKQEVIEKNYLYPTKYISTKDNIAYIRSGPAKDYPVILTITNKGFPLKVLRVYNEWYNVEDYLGNQGWIFINITSKKQTAITISNNANIYQNSNIKSKVVAISQFNYILDFVKCENLATICKIEFYHNNKKLTGWISRDNIWGGEKID
jgi:SH3-like domain-containing protein